MGHPAARRLQPYALAALLSLLAAAPSAESPPESDDPSGWQRLEPGFELGVFDAPIRSAIGDSRVVVARVHPDTLEPRLLCASALPDPKTRSARDWCAATGAVAAINSSMYQTDHRTSVSYMRAGRHVNNSHISKDKTFLAFGPSAPDLPPVRLLDRECDPADSLRERYHSVIQSIRMISCRGENVWSRQDRRWSTAAIGIDGSGRLLLIHCRSPYSVHDFIEVLRALPLDLAGAMYAEGGPEAQLFVGAGGAEREWVGGFETGFWEGEMNAAAWPVPNVLGVFRRPPTAGTVDR